MHPEVVIMNLLIHIYYSQGVSVTLLPFLLQLWHLNKIRSVAESTLSKIGVYDSANQVYIATY